jgi:tRNA A-37 threonylcarbamoyl transferase component Bud32
VTPIEYSKVKDVFAQAIQTPDEDRVEFVKQRCGDDRHLADEVFSLLKHHADETIMATGDGGLATVASVDQDGLHAGAAADSAQGKTVVVDVTNPADAYLVLSDVWNDNRQILRRRLIIIASLLATLIAVSSLRLFTNQNAEWADGARFTAIATCLLSAWVLRRNPQLTLTQIRIAEWLVMATVGFFVVDVYVRLMLTFGANNDEATLISVNNWHYFAWSMIIFIYGVFMPNRWQRAAAILLPVAAIPGLVILLVSWWEPNIPILLNEDQFGQPLPTTFVAAAISIYAAYLIHGARLSAFQARRLAQYELKRLIGSGGMGQVYEAEHLLLKRTCAVKLIRPEHCADDAALRRFKQEVRATAKLTHPNTIEIYDYGQTKDGVFFFAMELLPGMNLQTLVDAYGPMNPGRVAHFLTQVCDALAEAHDAGLIHRDIKPANIFASQRGGIDDFTKLLDFGVVRTVNVDLGLTRVGERIVGTPTYMSPEQISAPDKIDGRSDLYGLAAVGYFLLTGRPPLVGDSPLETMLAQVDRVPIAPADRNQKIPTDLSDVIMRCLSKHADERPENARQMLMELESCDCTGSWTREQATSWWKDLASLGSE